MLLELVCPLETPAGPTESLRDLPPSALQGKHKSQDREESFMREKMRTRWKKTTSARSQMGRAADETRRGGGGTCRSATPRTLTLMAAIYSGQHI